MVNEPTDENLSHVTTARQLVQDHQISQDVISNFFYRPPNDYQIYDISYREIQISFELVSELLDSNNNTSYSVQPNNSHEFYFLKAEEKKCYKVTCVLILHSSIVEYLNKNIHDGVNLIIMNNNKK